MLPTLTSLSLSYSIVISLDIVHVLPLFYSFVVGTLQIKNIERARNTTYHVHLTLCDVHINVCDIHLNVCDVHTNVYNVHLTVRDVQLIVYNVQFINVYYEL